MLRGRPRRDLAERFWEKVDIQENDKCWEWKAFTHPFSGYGMFQLKEGVRHAHRVAYMLETGKMPIGFLVCHKCNNRKCCNPQHLYAGTPKENMNDRENAGNHAKGMAKKNSKLTDLDVKKIRALRGEKSQRKISNIFGISKSIVGDIQLGKRWKHVQG